MTTPFADLGLPARLVESLAADGITDAFPVQAATLPDALAGRDLCCRAPTGSGKTLAFGIPLMVRIGQAEPSKPTGLVLVPTRELAEQVQRAFVPLGRAQWRFVQAIFGGTSFGPQIHSLRKGASVVVATPGRLLDIIDQGYCDLSAVEVCVIDEADRMADLGFMPQLRAVLDLTPTTRQTMLWSATLDGDVSELVRDYLRDPVVHDLVGDAADVEHRVIVTHPDDRVAAAAELIEQHGPTVVFVTTRDGVDDVSEALGRAGVSAGALHGARSQAVRQRVLDDFKRGRIQALVATDVAARGLHVDNVSLVLHYDLPASEKDYTHRSGRTGRAGNAGTVIAFVTPGREHLATRLRDGGDAASWDDDEWGNDDWGDQWNDDSWNDNAWTANSWDSATSGAASWQDTSDRHDDRADDERASDD
ncbi:MAG TPA: DEAD/DEAH box helicase, partial [Ilumatobacteraceae bacterium]|nr:DEAD/DEAH box helicase [Ilumatobacteraceae bacterium]